jgi:hypothetical protein
MSHIIVSQMADLVFSRGLRGGKEGYIELLTSIMLLSVGTEMSVGIVPHYFPL